ncbi:unnamed protein product [Darwinula stevensoni]|uniref:Uncharacterized protein n=1 Tax=Darwinula stevensoni TaxID=69355 RepID=A0A7R9FSZ1_9CRUS|nr:unnamed protein product [Darwinula stevensoni]CAG0903568.1 unnamed protein product [Darwinula stevensoni]
MLANIVNSSGPNSPRLINASFAAIFDNNDISKEFARKFSQLRFNIPDSPAVRRRLRGLLVGGPQHSLDSRMDLVTTLREVNRNGTHEHQDDDDDTFSSDEGKLERMEPPTRYRSQSMDEREGETWEKHLGSLHCSSQPNPIEEQLEQEASDSNGARSQQQ